MRFRISGAIGVLLCLSLENHSAAQDVFPGGTANKASGMASSLGCLGASCLSYNPANLHATAISTDLELGYVHVTQTYEHPEFDPVSVTVRSPIASAGLVQTIGQWSYGFYFLPINYGKTVINGLPRRIAGKFESLYVRNKVASYDMVVGGVYHLLPTTNIGLSMIRRYEKRELYASRVGEDTPLIRYEGRNAFYVPIIGTQFSISTLAKVGASYRFAKTKTYRGRQKAATSDDITNPRNISYDPAIAYLSLEIPVLENLSVRINNNRYFHAAGRGKVRDGLTSQVKHASLRDIDERSFDILYQHNPQFGFSASYGYSPSPWGAGTYSADNQEAYTSGTDFGLANNVNRKIYGLGCQYQVSATTTLNMALFDSLGKREIGPLGDRPGYYQSHVSGISAGLSGKL